MIEIIAQELRTQRSWGGYPLSEEESLRIAKRLLELMQAGDDGQGALVERLRARCSYGDTRLWQKHDPLSGEAADRIEALTRENAALRRDLDRYRDGLQVLATTYYKGDEHQDYAKHVLGNDAAERRLAEQRQVPVTPPSPESDQWQRLRDLLGLDGWHEGIWHGLPNPAQIVSHVEHVANERARLLKASLSSPEPDAELVRLRQTQAMKVLRGPLSKRATSAEFNEWDARDIVAYIDALERRLSKEGSGERQTVMLNGQYVELTGLALEVMRAMTKAEHQAVKDAFDRGYQGALGFARGVCDEHNADLDHVKSRIDRARHRKQGGA